ncbi:hypothetical protein, partial [Nonomuraea sp. NPDC048916]|uniref:hypothetical protein n=1 Tax=Nonomuraea sp. NPDC048916 TaxID=3154232 RepID=UPI0033D663AC
MSGNIPGSSSVSRRGFIAGTGSILGIAALTGRAAAARAEAAAAEVLGVQDSGVAGDVPVDREAEEVVEGGLGPGAQPVGPVVRLQRVAEDL